MNDKTKIRSLLEKWADATRNDRKDEILSGHDSDALIYDVLPPMMYEGTDAYRRSWDAWQPPFEAPSLFEIHDLKVAVGGGLAWAHCIVKCGGKLPDGKEVEDEVRAAFCLAMVNDGWKIQHQHLSMPLPQ